MTNYEPRWLDERTINFGAGGHPLPAAAKKLTRLAKSQRWTVRLTDGRDTAGNYFVTAELAYLEFEPSGVMVGIPKGHAFYDVRMTWHTRGTGTLRLFSSIWRHAPREGIGFDWRNASLKEITAVVSSHKMPLGVRVRCPVSPCTHHEDTPPGHTMDERDAMLSTLDKLKDHAKEHHPFVEPLWIVGKAEMVIF